MSQAMTAMLTVRGDASGAKAALSGLEGQMGGLEKAGARLNAMSSKLTKFDLGAGSMLKGALAGGIFTPFVKAFSDAEESAADMELAFMASGGKVGGVFDEINAKSQALSNSLPGSKKDTDQTARWLKQLGIAPEVIRDGALEAASSLRVLFKLSNEEAAKTGALMSQAFNLSGSEFAQGADLFQRANYGLGVTAGEYAGALSSAASQLKAMNITGYSGMQDMTVMLGMLKNSSLTGEKAGSAIDGMLKMSARFKETLKTDKSLAADLRKFGLSDVRFADEKGHIDPANFAVQLEKFRKLNDDDRSNLLGRIFGDTGGAAAMAIAAGGVEGWNNVVDKLSAQATLAQRMERIQKTLASQWESAGGNFGELVADVGKLFDDDLKAGVTAIAEMTKQASAFLQNHKEAARYIGYGVAAFAAFKLSAGALSLAMGTITGGIGKTARGLGKVGVFGGWARDKLRGKKGGALAAQVGGKGKEGLVSALRAHGAQPVRVVNWNEAGALGGGGFGGDGDGGLDKSKGDKKAKSEVKKKPGGRFSRIKGALGGATKVAGGAGRWAGGALSGAGRWAGGALAASALPAALSGGLGAGLGAKITGLVSSALPAITGGGLGTKLKGFAGDAMETMTPLLGGAGKALGKLARPIGMASDLFSLGSAVAEGDAEGMGSAGGSLAGGLAGAAAGAAIGSVVPVIGTAIGGVVGGIIGSFGGERIGGWFGSLFKSDPAPPLPPPEAIKPAPAIIAASNAPKPIALDSQISINLQGIDTTNANAVAQAIKEQAENIVQMVMDRMRRHQQLSF